MADWNAVRRAEQIRNQADELYAAAQEVLRQMGAAEASLSEVLEAAQQLTIDNAADMAAGETARKAGQAAAEVAAGQCSQLSAASNDLTRAYGSDLPAQAPIAQPSSDSPRPLALPELKSLLPADWASAPLIALPADAEEWDRLAENMTALEKELEAELAKAEPIAEDAEPIADNIERHDGLQETPQDDRNSPARHEPKREPE
jgi:hypothetical protein